MNLNFNAPTISGTVAGQAVADNGMLHPFASVQIVDVDVGKTESATVTLAQPGSGGLVGGPLGNYDPATGIYTISGSAADVTAALQALTFVPTDHQVAPGQAVSTNLTLAVTDGNGGSAVDSTTTIIATATEDAPTISGTVAGQAVADNGTLHPFASVQIVDVDVGKTESATVTLDQPGSGGLVGGPLGNYDPATGIYTISGSAADVTAALQALTFVPTDHQVAPGQAVSTNLTLAVTDGNGGSAVDSTTTIIATATEDAPTISGTVAGQAVADNGTLHPFASVQIVDVDVGKTESATVTLDQPGSGGLVGGPLGNYDPATGIYTISGSAADVTAALQALTFVPTDHQVAPGQAVSTNLTLAVTDGNGGSAVDSTTTIIATATEDAPTISGTVAGQAVADNGTLHPFASVQIVDVDVGKTESATVTLDQPGSGGLVGGPLGNYDPATGIYTISGSAADVTAALQALTFVPTDHQVAPGQAVSTNLTLAVTDGNGGSAVDSTTTIIATATEDAPTISGTVAGQAVADNGTLHPFASVQIVDVDVGKTESATVTLDQPGSGGLVGGPLGNYDPATGIYTISGSAADVTAALQGLAFISDRANAATHQGLQVNLTIEVNDGRGGITSDATTTINIGGREHHQASFAASVDRTHSNGGAPGTAPAHIFNYNGPASPVSHALVAGLVVGASIASSGVSADNGVSVPDRGASNYPSNHTAYPTNSETSITPEQMLCRSVLSRVVWHEVVATSPNDPQFIGHFAEANSLVNYSSETTHHGQYVNLSLSPISGDHEHERHHPPSDHHGPLF